MAEDPEVIRAQMEQTRASLTEKLEALESQVVGTVQEATSAVADTVETIKEAAQETVGTVKDTVHDTVESVRETFDVRLQFQRRPWFMVGGSVLLGYLAGSLVDGRGRRRRRPLMGNAAAPSSNRVAEPPRELMASAPPRPVSNGLGHKLSEALQPELERLKGIAIGALIGIVRDVTASSINGEVGDQLREAFDNVTERLGGRTFKQPILPELEQGLSKREGPPDRAEGIRRF
jgi:uncharacterized protein YjbJ (UPF0337 family)